MARPRSYSDEELLDAAQSALDSLGPTGFTLTDAASAAGISRPALIQRMGSREALLRQMAARQLRLLYDRLEGIPLGRGRGATWAFLQEYLAPLGAGEGAASRLAMVALEAADAELGATARERRRLVVESIAARLPGDAPEGQAEVLHALMLGAEQQWVIQQEGALSAHVLRRLRDHLSTLWPRQELALPEEG